MAYYKYNDHLTHNKGKAFDREYVPGETVPHSGIYRCINCGLEVTCIESEPLPPQNHHQHDTQEKPIIWKLIVATATHRKK